MEHQTTSGPNPLCEVGKTHPRDRHRMRPLEDFPGVWVCTKHDLFATVIDKDVADALNRGDAFPMHDGSEGVASRHGDERPNGVVIYYRAASS